MYEVCPIDVLELGSRMASNSEELFITEGEILAYLSEHCPSSTGRTWCHLLSIEDKNPDGRSRSTVSDVQQTHPSLKHFGKMREQGFAFFCALKCLSLPRSFCLNPLLSLKSLVNEVCDVPKKDYPHLCRLRCHKCRQHWMHHPL